MEEQAYEQGKNVERHSLDLSLRRGDDPRTVSEEAFVEVMGEITHNQEMLREYPESEFWQAQLAFNQGRLSVLD